MCSQYTQYTFTFPHICSTFCVENECSCFLPFARLAFKHFPFQTLQHILICHATLSQPEENLPFLGFIQSTTCLKVFPGQQTMCSRVIQKKLFFLVDKKRLNHRCQYVWRAQTSIFRFLTQKMAVFRHFLVLGGNIAEGISKNPLWAITFDWNVLRT